MHIPTDRLKKLTTSIKNMLHNAYLKIHHLQLTRKSSWIILQFTKE